MWVVSSSLLSPGHCNLGLRGIITQLKTNHRLIFTWSCQLSWIDYSHLISKPESQKYKHFRNTASSLSLFLSLCPKPLNQKKTILLKLLYADSSTHIDNICYQDFILHFKIICHLWKKNYCFGRFSGNKCSPCEILEKRKGNSSLNTLKHSATSKSLEKSTQSKPLADFLTFLFS